MAVRLLAGLEIINKVKKIVRPTLPVLNMDVYLTMGHYSPIIDFIHTTCSSTSSSSLAVLPAVID